MPSLVSEEPSVDARHTIDSTRQWIEHSSASQRFQFDQELIRHPEKWGGPFELTGRLLSLLRALHANSDNGTEQLDKVAHLLVESLERAAETVYPGSVQRLYILGLLGIFLDASAELGWQAMESKTYLFRLAVGLLVDLIWRDEESGKIAVGFLDRIAMRDGSFASKVAAMLPSAILVRLSREANDPYAAVDVQGAGRLMPIATIFEICLSMMISSSSFEDAARYIQSNLLDPLSTLLSKMLERTIEDPSDEHIAELDTVSTRLYDLCDKALQVGSM